jgi:hypothetical protein
MPEREQQRGLTCCGGGAFTACVELSFASMITPTTLLTCANPSLSGLISLCTWLHFIVHTFWQDTGTVSPSVILLLRPSYLRILWAVYYGIIFFCYGHHMVLWYCTFWYFVFWYYGIILFLLRSSYGNMVLYFLVFWQYGIIVCFPRSSYMNILRAVYYEVHNITVVLYMNSF